MPSLSLSLSFSNSKGPTETALTHSLTLLPLGGDRENRKEIETDGEIETDER